MPDLDMIEEATTRSGTEQGRKALERAAHVWQCYANGVRAESADV